MPRKSTSPAKRAASKTRGSPKKTPKKTPRGRSSSKGPGKRATSRSRTPSRSAPQSTTKAHRKTSPTKKATPKPKSADTPTHTQTLRQRAVAHNTAAASAKSPAHKDVAKSGTVGSLLAQVRSNTLRGLTSSKGGRRGQAWYMYHGHNILMYAFIMVMIVCLLFGAYHYRADLATQFDRLRARFYKR